jgi:photosystem II stability/assembly factor-like uncharacterized protein
MIHFSFCHGQWVEYQPETEGIFRSVKFKNQSEGLILGHDGMVMITSDRGESWTILPNDLDEDFFDFQFINNTLIYAYAPGMIWLSADFGTSWEEKSALPSLARMAYFLDQDTGFAGNNIYGLERTDNGGSTWYAIWDHPADNVTYCEVHSMDFTNDLVGYAGGSGRTVGGGGFSFIIKTVDGGSHWSEVFGISSDTISHPVDIQCVNGSVICAVDEDFDLLRSIDAGETWSVEKFIDPDRRGVQADITATSIYALSKDTIFVTGETTVWLLKSKCFSKRKILRTTDGGKQWINQFFEEGEFPECGTPLLGNITFVTDSTGFCPGYNLILRTINRGGDIHMPDTAIHGSIEDLTWDESGILIFPNPTSRCLTLELNTGNFDKLDIFSLTGTLIRTLPLRRINTIDLAPFSSGSYILKFSGKSTCYKRILITR